MQILLIGGAGYIGNALIQSLVAVEEITQIRIYDNLSQGKQVLLQNVVKSPKIAFIQADILDNYELKKALKDIDVVVHLATVNHLTEHHYIEQVNHWGTANICNLIEENTVKKMLFLSTTEIYGEDAGMITMDSQDNPQTPFAKSMLRAENYVKTMQKRCEVKIIRTATCYGFNSAMHLETGLNKHFFEAKYHNLLQLDADGLHKQSAVYIGDLAKREVKRILSQFRGDFYESSFEINR